MGNEFEQIFVGTVIDVRPGSGTFLFRIDEPLKGIAPGTKVMEVGSGPCGSAYTTDRNYLILVRSVERTSFFTYGEPADEATESIDFFRSLARGEHVTFIKGRVTENVEDSMVEYEMDVEHRPGLPGVEITASNEGQDYRVFSNPTGAYSLRVPVAGQYQLAAKRPGHAAANPTYELNLAPNSCK